MVTSGPHKGHAGRIVFVDYCQDEATIAIDQFIALLKFPLTLVKPEM